MLNKVIIGLSIALVVLGVGGCDQVKGLLTDAARGKTPFEASAASDTSSASSASVASAPTESPDVARAKKMAATGEQHRQLCATYAKRLSVVNERLAYGGQAWEIEKLKAKRAEIQAAAKQSGC